MARIAIDRRQTARLRRTLLSANAMSGRLRVLWRPALGNKRRRTVRTRRILRILSDGTDAPPLPFGAGR